MAKVMRRYVCRSCGAVHARWLGKCPDCGAWDSLDEQRQSAAAQQDRQRGLSAESAEQPGTTPKAQPVNEVAEAQYPRMATTIGEFDRVLGGEDGQRGIVPGSAVLIGGDPGIGKSTLMLQAAAQLARNDRPVLYVTSEESAQQTRLRADRLGAVADGLFVLADTNLARIVEQIRQVDPAVVVIDSIQMAYKGDLEAAPGSVSQLRACCMELVYLAKASGIGVFLIGHVTKQGSLAGPRLLEHLVDAVLYFEGDRYHSHRLIRAIKNRFGTTQEVGIFEMSERGLREVSDPSGLLAAEYSSGQSRHAGSVICPVMQGSRCLLVEIQALTATSFLGAAKRRVSGLDGNRLAMLIAVLEKRGGLRLADQDVFTSVVGGMKVAEPAADLAICLSICGAHLNRQLDSGCCVFGEVGLGGELRAVQQIELRLREATRLGFTQVITPKLAPSVHRPDGCRVVEVASLDRAIEQLD